MQVTQVQSLGQEDPLEEEIATHSSILPWKIPWTEELGRLQSMGSQSRTRLGNWAWAHKVILLIGGSQRHYGSVYLFIYLNLISLMSSLPILPTAHETFHLKSLNHKLWIQEVFFGQYPPVPMRWTNWIGRQAGQLLPAQPWPNWAADLESFLPSPQRCPSKKPKRDFLVIQWLRICAGTVYHSQDMEAT